MPDRCNPQSYNCIGPYSCNPLGFKKEVIDLLGAIIGITTNHHEIHEGNFYTLGCTFIAVPNNQYAEAHIVMGAERDFHFAVNVVAEGKSFAFLYRNSTYTAVGTPLNIVNSNCASTNVASFTAFRDPEIETLGDLLTPENGTLIPGGPGPQSVGAGSKFDEERVAAVNNDYLVRVQNVAGVPKDITIEISGYEDGLSVLQG
jgi:hypothetical protein